MTIELNSLADLAMHIGAAAVEIERNQGRRALNEAAKLIKAEPGRRLGTTRLRSSPIPPGRPSLRAPRRIRRALEHQRTRPLSGKAT